MRIAHIGLGTGPPLLYEYGGAIQRKILELARAQAANGHSVIAYSNGTESKSVHQDGVEIQFVPVSGPRLSASFEFQSRVVRHLEYGGEPAPDVLHFHSNPEGAWFSRRVPSLTVLAFDNVYFRGRVGAALRPAYRRLLRHFDVLLACSEYCRSAFVAHWRLPGEGVGVLRNGVNTQQFRPDPVSAAELRGLLRLEGPVILYVGRVCEQKGVDTLLAAYRHLSGSRHTNLVIAGPIGAFGTEVKTTPRWEQALTADGVRYLGPIPESGLASLYNIADVFVMPTRELEMFGMAAVEAQACGKPVIASDHGGLRETVPSECGRSFAVGDANQLAMQLESLLESAETRADLGRCALEHSQQYDWSRVVVDLDAEYAAGVAARKRSSSDSPITTPNELPG